MRDKIVIVWSDRSDAGKDTVADFLCEFNSSFTKIKISREFKGTLEHWLDIPVGSLDDKDFRKQQVVNTVTGEKLCFDYNHFMVQMFVQFKQLPGGNFLIPGAAKKTIMNTPGNKVVVDVRSPIELTMLKQLKTTHELILLQVTGRGIQRDSDKDIKVTDFVFVDRMFVINNGSEISIADLKNKVSEIEQIIIKPTEAIILKTE